MKLIDLVGQRFERLKVVSRADNTEQGQSRWNCICDCGNKSVVSGSMLRGDKTKSCGCFRSEVTRSRRITHGHTVNAIDSKTMTTWGAMMARCYNQNNIAFPRYGGSGITVCERWHTFQFFLDDMGERPDNHTIDRIDNSLGYFPENCQWSSNKEQARNKTNNRLITANGETRCLQEWAEITGIHPMSLLHRLNNGWSSEDAVNLPISKSPSEAARKSKNAKLISHEGKTMCIKEWADFTGIPYMVIWRRFKAGKNPAEILTKY